MKKLSISFDDLADSNYLGMYFKDEGDYLVVKFNKQTKQPVSNGLLPFGSTLSAYITAIDMEGIDTEKQLKEFMYNQVNKA